MVPRRGQGSCWAAYLPLQENPGKVFVAVKAFLGKSTWTAGSGQPTRSGAQELVSEGPRWIPTAPRSVPSPPIICRVLQPGMTLPRTQTLPRAHRGWEPRVWSPRPLGNHPDSQNTLAPVTQHPPPSGQVGGGSSRGLSNWQ